MQMQHRYFLLNPKQKRNFQIKLIFIGLLVLIPVLLLCFYFNIYFLASITFWIVVSIGAPFFDVPAMIRTGKLQYYSLFLLAEDEKNQEIVIHGGTLFDYYFNLNKKHTSKERKLQILSEYLSGILKIIDQNQHKPDTQIRGTTYILNKRTAKKIGFELKDTDAIQKIILVLNYPNLLVAQSIAHKKPSFPNLKAIKTYEADIATLSKHKEAIIGIKSRLLHTTGNQPETNAFY